MNEIQVVKARTLALSAYVIIVTGVLFILLSLLVDAALVRILGPTITGAGLLLFYRAMLSGYHLSNPRAFIFVTYIITILGLIFSSVLLLGFIAPLIFGSFTPSLVSSGAMIWLTGLLLAGAGLALIRKTNKANALSGTRHVVTTRPNLSDSIAGAVAGLLLPGALFTLAYIWPEILLTFSRPEARDENWGLAVLWGLGIVLAGIVYLVLASFLFIKTAQKQPRFAASFTRVTSMIVFLFLVWLIAVGGLL